MHIGATPMVNVLKFWTLDQAACQKDLDKQRRPRPDPDQDLLFAIPLSVLWIPALTTNISLE